MRLFLLFFALILLTVVQLDSLTWTPFNMDQANTRCKDFHNPKFKYDCIRNVLTEMMQKLKSNITNVANNI